jgi:MOSC domain-containing protein YiiM
MKLVSVNVGLPHEVEWRRDIVATAIHKTPVTGRVAVKRLNLDGDRQADLSVHGGPEKAVYAYPTEHYAFWREELPGIPLPWGVFGENLSIEGFREAEIRVGDVLRIGTTELVVTQPRMPCYKLNVRFQRSEMVKRFLRSGRSGFYFAVLKEGYLEAGDSIEWVPAGEQAVTIAEISALYTSERDNQDLLQRAIATAGLPESWRDYFRQQLSVADVAGDSAQSTRER